LARFGSKIRFTSDVEFLAVEVGTHGNESLAVYFGEIDAGERAPTAFMISERGRPFEAGELVIAHDSLDGVLKLRECFERLDIEVADFGPLQADAGRDEGGVGPIEAHDLVDIMGHFGLPIGARNFFCGSHCLTSLGRVDDHQRIFVVVASMPSCNRFIG